MYTDRKMLDEQIVPCGNCIGCRAEQSRQWAVRMMHEERMHENSAFITLTYEDEKLNENRELVTRDFSSFIRALRKTQERPFSFYGCGEYGDLTGRPHYHALLFGYGFLDCDIGFDTGRPSVWRSKTLGDTWGRGLCEGGTVTMASASYVSGYMRKKVKTTRYERANPLTGVLLQPEFARMSLRPPIGRTWIEKNWTDVYPRDYVVVDGREAKPPRYYDRFMDFEDEKGGSAERREIMECVRQARMDESRPITQYALRAGEKAAQTKANLYSARTAI